MCCTIKFIEKLNFLCVLILLNRGKIKFTSLVEVMKRAASCKHRQAVKNIQCEKKLFNSHLHSSYVRRTCWETCDFNISEDGRQNEKPSCPLVVVKTKVKSDFLLWHRQGDISSFKDIINSTNKVKLWWILNIKVG